MYVWFIWLAIFLSFVFLRLFLKKRFGIDQEEKAGVPVNKFERWNGWVMMAAIIVLFILLRGSLEVFFAWMFVVFLVVCAVQTFLEWKYLKKSRKYQMSLTYFTFVTVGIIVFISIVSWQMG